MVAARRLSRRAFLGGSWQAEHHMWGSASRGVGERRRSVFYKSRILCGSEERCFLEGEKRTANLLWWRSPVNNSGEGSGGCIAEIAAAPHLAERLYAAEIRACARRASCGAGGRVSKQRVPRCVVTEKQHVAWSSEIHSDDEGRKCGAGSSGSGLKDRDFENEWTTCGMSPVAPMALLRVTSCKAEMSTAGDRTVRGDRDRAVDIARGRVDSSIAKLSSEIACARRWSVARRAREKYTNNNYLREINYSVDEDSRRVAADLRSSDSQYLECAYLTAAIQLAAIAKELIVIVLAACGIIMPPNTASADSVVGVYDELRAEARSQGRGSEYSDASGSRFTVSGGDGLSARCGGEVVVGRVINPSPRDLYLGDKSERSEDARHRGIEWVLSMLSCAGSYARARRFRIAYTTGYDQQYEAKNRCISSLVNTTQILED
ncbi:hypothetical protein Tco_1370283 [Tanacetum coccineum]|uniref:Uncharacterized protein n=1 Tax=Tanacetum coccineum TaxID=301880 RepID=A0ABQ5ERF1_9ASTR